MYFFNAFTLITITTIRLAKIFDKYSNEPNLVNSSFLSSWKVTKPLYETGAKVDLAQLEKWK